MRMNWQGSIVAIVTPFNEDGSVDYRALDDLIEFHIENQSDGIVVCGTTGEAATLSKEEYSEVIKFVIDKVNKRIPVIAGTGSNSTMTAVANSQMAESLGADAVLVVSPYYNKPTRKGLKDYFTQVASAISVPVIMYNVPGRTASNIPADLVVELANEIENIAGIKEASGNLEQLACILRDKPDGFMVFSGDDALAFPAVCMGADGVISVAANLFPKEFHDFMQAALTGDLITARELHFKYLNIIQLCFIESNPIPVKTGLSLMGKVQEEFRSPMCRMEDENKTQLMVELQKLLVQTNTYMTEIEEL
ncbi:4-hydroxy-tetrahydrodipicolinate synthase [Marinifilum sp. D737]|uniref:4-hydroxy-tetrahydrodipicolinate synthase n=1 Tax=Marinifilum sp. D737 TaxID=2969628 RepID=UPI0022741AE0|nr:4-hydroxy-tetrahydrodipicolinate synthase [Marinifilum sp. D737]MCY1634092.1 4-hydroxy-tetrahydrodipicolinate synthase [Marinifilum sp. D737]